jgi:hypothetical protein
MRLRQLAVAVIVAAPLFLSACGAKGTQCDTCSKDSDCESEYICDTFIDQFGRSLGRACDDGRGRTCTFASQSSKAQQ